MKSHDPLPAKFADIFFNFDLGRCQCRGETWRRKDNDWKLVLTHVYVAAKDPPAISVPASKLDEYVGRYQAGPGVIAVISRDGDHLTLKDRETKPAKPLLPSPWDMEKPSSWPRIIPPIAR